MAKKLKDLVQLIRDNPGARFVVDNDWWCMLPAGSGTETEEYEDEIQLANSGEVIRRGDGGYGSGNTYGGDILQALAVIAGVTIESV